MRLVDLHCDWLRQYATETTLHQASLYPEVADRVGRLDGYLLGTSLAVLACARKPEDWSAQPDPWGSLGLMLARYESEFAGRLMREVAEAERWRSLPADGLCWGVLGVAGFDFLVRQADDLDRLPALFERGVRVFQPIASKDGVLGGSTVPDDERGLSDLGRAFLDRLAHLTRAGDSAPRPILDLAGMNAASVADTMRRLDPDGPGSRTCLLAMSRGTTHYPDLLDDSSPDYRNLVEIRNRGGLIGLTPGLSGCETAAELNSLVERIASVPFEGRPGFEGIGIGSDLLGLDRPAPGIGSAREIARSLENVFGSETAAHLIVGNARRLLLLSAGASPLPSPRTTSDPGGR